MLQIYMQYFSIQNKANQNTTHLIDNQAIDLDTMVKIWVIPYL